MNRYPVEDLNTAYSDEDNGTIQANVEELAESVVGRRIVSAHRGEMKYNYYGQPRGTDGLIITLDDGTQVGMSDTSDCCAFTYLEDFLLDPSSVDHMIMGVGTTEGATVWHIYADFGDIMKLKVAWSCGNPFYYGYGFDIRVTPLGDTPT